MNLEKPKQSNLQTLLIWLGLRLSLPPGWCCWLTCVFRQGDGQGFVVGQGLCDEAHSQAIAPKLSRATVWTLQSGKLWL